jgi:cytidylate kinase
VDRARERFTRYFFGPHAVSPCEYDLVVNTGRVPLDIVVELVAHLVRDGSIEECASGAPGGRILTLARELGALESGFEPALAARLHLRCHDRGLLEQEAGRLGVPEALVERIDETAVGPVALHRPSGIERRYFEIMGQLMDELATGGDVLIVGRGGGCFLRDHPRGFHVRLVASMSVRIRRVMEYRWVAEGPARKLIAESDERRRRFHRDFFDFDWGDPLGYFQT